jgi:hypothetical protein
MRPGLRVVRRPVSIVLTEGQGFLEGESTESLIRFKGGPAFRTNLGLGPYLA